MWSGPGVAKAALEAEAKAVAEARGAEAKRARGGRKPQHPPGQPKPQVQRSITDPNSCIMVGKDGFIQAYNARIAVDTAAQYHPRPPTGQDPWRRGGGGAAGRRGEGPYRPHAEGGLRRRGVLLGGHAAAIAERRIKAAFATGRAMDPAGGEAQRREPLIAAMRDTLRRARHRSRYRLPKQVVEPVFGQIKQARGFRQFLLRGTAKIGHEWALICTAHNLAKLCRP